MLMGFLSKLLKGQLDAMNKLLIVEYFIHSTTQYQTDLIISMEVNLLTYFIVTSSAVCLLLVLPKRWVSLVNYCIKLPQWKSIFPKETSQGNSATFATAISHLFEVAADNIAAIDTRLQWELHSLLRLLPLLPVRRWQCGWQLFCQFGRNKK